LIEIKNLQKIVGQQLVLDIGALRVEAGEIAAVVGAADSGVTVLFDLLTGRRKPSGGTLRLAGVDPAERATLSRKLGVVFADDALYRRLSPQANLSLHCRLYGIEPSRATQVLAQVGMADQANTRLERLSTGLLRRLALARAILHRPAVLLLFDPFARCDEATISLLSGLMRELAEEGAALLVLADDATHLTPVCDAVYSLAKGRLTETQRPEDRQGGAQPFKIPVRADEKVILMNPADILYAEAEGGRARLQTASGRLATQFTLAELEERLGRSGFFRAHRSYLVNLQHVREILPYTRNSFSLRLDDAEGTEIPLSKAAAGTLRDLLGY